MTTYYRKKKRPLLDFLDIRGQFFDEYPDPASLEEEKNEVEQRLAEHHVFVEVLDIIKKLSPKYQAVLTLRFFEGKSIKEISEIVRQNEGTVKSLISRGVVMIRSQLKNPSSIFMKEEK